MAAEKDRDQLLLSILQRCPPRRESKKMTKEYHGPILDVHFREMLVLGRCSFSARVLTRLQLL